ncbi:probable sodium-coupled neutral amino acid transporter 6 isoform X2 [Prunus persica]|uniref:probable sodium-coupled neutral amino acid transporter 6 isoform X2 n=1 Tax=Prunus persica TaxID=3760 RepID=UPI0009AB593A|nr:probable sodium-coupled neutral amino acid transporter 6 isoform X2 [Prunus persica]
MKVKAREEEKLSLTVNQQEKKTMTTDSKQTKNPRKCKQPINEESPLLPNQRGCDEQAVQEFNGASFAGAVFNLSTTIIGAGIMALPATMKVLGLGVGIGMIIFVAILTQASVEMLLRFSKVGKVVSFGGVMGDAFGKAGKVVFQLCILVNNLGTLIVYTIIIGDVLSGTSSTGVHHAGVLEGWFGEHWWNGRTFVLLVTTIFVFAPLASLKRIDSLRYTSALAVALAVVFLVITAGIVVIKFFYGGISMPRFLPNVSNIASVWNLFTVVPVLVTAFICHFNVHTIGNELEDSSLIQPIVQTSLALCSSVYILTSLFGFLLFGDSTHDDVLANFDTNLGIPYSYLLNDIVRINNCRFALSTIGLISVVFVGANFIPSIWDVFQFSGATATVCIGFIFPAAIALRDRHQIATRKDKIFSVFMIGLAVFSNVIAIYSDTTALLKQVVSHGA